MRLSWLAAGSTKSGPSMGSPERLKPLMAGFSRKFEEAAVQADALILVQPGAGGERMPERASEFKVESETTVMDPVVSGPV